MEEEPQADRQIHRRAKMQEKKEASPTAIVRFHDRELFG